MWQFKKKNWWQMALVVLGLALVSLGTYSDTVQAALAQQVEIHFIDVGQGDSILIRTDTGKSILIDGGDRSEATTVVSYLHQVGVRQLDLMVSTHPHADHIGGLDDVLRNFPVKRVLDSGIPYSTSTYEEYLALILQKKIPFDTPATTKEYAFDGVSFRILGPKRTHDDTNNNSVVIKMVFDEFSALFTGDLEADAEKDYLFTNLRSTLLKVGHHGSDTSTSDLFLLKVKPQLAVISVGQGNKYGHPAETTLAKLNRNGVDIYRTDLQGTVIVSSTGKSFSVNQSAASWQKTGNSYGAQNAHGHPGLYVGSVNSNKYHEPDCRYAEKISDDNQIWFKSAQEAIQAGYQPCGVCKPPQK